MKIETTQKLLKIYPEIADLFEAAYVIGIYSDHIDIQANFISNFVQRFISKANWKLSESTGYVEGQMEIDGLLIKIVLT